MSATTCCVSSCPTPAAPGRARCRKHERQRIATRDHARRKRARALAEALKASERCPFGIGAQVCGGQLRPEVDRRLGTTVWICDQCERRKAGVCRDCPRPVYGTRGRAIRCEKHHQLERAAAQARHRERQPEKFAEKERHRMADPERRQRRLEYKRAWRKANRDKVRQQKRRRALRQSKEVKRYHDRYNQRHREYYREMARERYYRLNPDRPAPVCVDCGNAIPFVPPGRPAKHCDNCVYPSERRRREAVRARRQAALAAAPDFGLPPKPMKVRRPRGIAVRLETGERLCLTTGCTTVVVGRAKKCDGCKAAEAEQARARVGVGRGRRVDLERHEAA